MFFELKILFEAPLIWSSTYKVCILWEDIKITQAE